MDAATNVLKYETKSKAQRLLIWRFQNRVCELIAPLKIKTVLDVGCGEGYLSRVLLDRFPGLELSGIDASEVAVEAARKRCPEATFRQGMVEDLVEDKELYDLVVCSEVLEHLQKPHSALETLADHAQRYALLTVPWEPWFQLANFLRGKYLVNLGNHPEHINRWTQQRFVQMVSRSFIPLDTDTRFPWTIFLGKTIRH